MNDYQTPQPDASEPNAAQPFRAGFISIAGRPNVGKSTLLNALAGQKLAAVTSKPQTTRHRISAIQTTETAQFIYLDTPGIFPPRYKLQEHMVKAAYDAVKGADAILYVMDACAKDRGPDWEILDRLRSANAPAALAVNKIDRVYKPLLLPILDECAQRKQFVQMTPISALKRDGLDLLIEALEPLLPESPPLFPPDQMSDLPERFFIAETVREKVFLKTRQEAPYASSVVVEEWVQEPGASRAFIRAAIYVERSTQKAILIGKGGSMLKKIGTAARKDIEAFLGGPVFLELYVGVRKRWRDNDLSLREFGYGE